MRFDDFVVAAPVATKQEKSEEFNASTLNGQSRQHNHDVKQARRSVKNITQTISLTTVEKHYQHVLLDVYSWMQGGYAVQLTRHRSIDAMDNLFRKQDNRAGAERVINDLKDAIKRTEQQQLR